jgi:hypothetical protein
MVEQAKKDDFRWSSRLPDLHRDQLAEIGRFVVCWSFLDEHVSVALASLLRLNTNQQLAVTLPIRDLSTRLAIMLGLVQQTDRNVAERELRPIVDEIMRLYEVRNALTNRPWWSSSKNEFYSFNLSPDKLPFHPEERWQLRDLQRASKSIVVLIDRLQDFAAKHVLTFDTTRANTGSDT